MLFNRAIAPPPHAPTYNYIRIRTSIKTSIEQQKILYRLRDNVYRYTTTRWGNPQRNVLYRISWESEAVQRRFISGVTKTNSISEWQIYVYFAKCYSKSRGQCNSPVLEDFTFRASLHLGRCGQRND